MATRNHRLAEFNNSPPPGYGYNCLDHNARKFLAATALIEALYWIKRGVQTLENEKRFK
jgi:hypothetical protein